MAGRRKRTLSGAERADWDHVARTVSGYHRPCPPDAPSADPTPPSGNPPRVRSTTARTAIPQGFGVGARSAPTPQIVTNRTPDIAQTLSEATPQVDGKRLAQLKRGKARPDARIDLHGMTLAQAQPILTQFLWRAHGRGHRLVLVITGKGRRQDPVSDRVLPQGALRRHVPEWLRTQTLAPIVLQITPAHHRHGGDGAFYVALRRKR